MGWESLQRRATCGRQRPGEASDAPCPKSPGSGPASPTATAGAELCATKAWLRRAYNSHNAAPAGTGELQLPRGGAPRSAYSKRAAESRPGLASKQRPSAGGERASGRQRARVPGAPGRPGQPPRVPPTPASLLEHAPGPSCSPAPCKHSLLGSPHPPAPGAPAWLHSSRRLCGPRSPRPLWRGTSRARIGGEEGSRHRKGGGGNAGGKPPAPSMAGTAAEPRGSVCNLQTSRLVRLQRTKVAGQLGGPTFRGRKVPG